MPNFIRGLELGGDFYREVVKPVVSKTVPGLRHSAALIGSGSEILGFDTEMSSDHHWGPRVMLFLNEEDHELYNHQLHKALSSELPLTFHGFPTNFTEPDLADNGTQLLKAVEHGPVNHRVDVFTIGGYFRAYLGFDVQDEIMTADWLSFPEQKLRTIICGEVYRDDVGLETIRKRFEYYPHEVWLYLLASGWNRIGQEEHLMGRAGIAGDEIGSALIAARLVRDVMRLCFLMERQYAPYPKWLGTAFKHLACGQSLWPHLEKILQATSWQDREEHLITAYEMIASMHNNLGITERLSSRVGNFFGRPFKVIALAGGFAERIVDQIVDADIKRLATNGLIGGIDQISDNTDILSDSKWRDHFRGLYH